MGRTRWLTVLAGVSAVALAQGITASAEVNPQPVDITHNVYNAPAPVPNTAFDMPTTPVAAGVPICSTAPSNDANVNTDCNDNNTAGPHNETSIAVNPANPLNMIGGANDYQLTLNPDGHVSESILSRAHVTFDGGQTWSMYGVFSNSTYQATGDPALAFDASGHAYYGTLGFRFVSSFNAENPDVLVSNSGDGGKSWTEVRVAAGSGVETGTGDLLDKEYVAAWGSGNAIVTFGDFKLSKGFITGSSIFASVTHDFGAHWTTPVVISGSDNEAFVSTPALTGDRILVSYLNTRDLNTGRDDVRVVEVSPTTGAALGAPVTVQQDIVDGATDYPFDVDGRQTYHNSQLRTWAAGNLAADPTTPGHLAMVWSDMRNSMLPSPADPYQAGAFTNSDIIVSQTTDYGAHWTTPEAITLSGDQFMPWAAYDTGGHLRIGFFDRSADSANLLYNYTLATEKQAGSLNFKFATVTTTQSDPTKGDRWFGRNVNANFPHATAFMGDYSNIAALPSGGVVAYWTDLRVPATFAGITRHGEDAFFAAVS